VSPFDFKFKFQNPIRIQQVFNMKIVVIEILKISYFGNFSSCYMVLGVIWQK
jgi:hypothetical protein